MSRLTVLFLIDSLGTGGAERALAEKLPHLRRLGIATICVALRPRDEGVQRELQADGFEVHVLDARGFLSRLVALRRLLRARRPDLVETTLFHADLVGRVAAAGTGIPLVTRLVNTDYDPVRLQDPALGKTRFHVSRALDGWTARHLTSRVYANSEAVRTAAVRDLGLRSASVTVFREGRDPGRLVERSAERREAARAALGLDSGQEVLVTVGRQDFQKGHPFLLEALALLLPSRPRLVLLIAGRAGDSSRRLEALCTTLGIGAHVRFLGHRDDVPEVLAAGDLFAFPSLYEGLPGAVVEAMALGLPIVASDIAPVREAIGHEQNARLVAAADPVALAEAIRGVLDDPDTARTLGRRGRAQFETHGGIELVCGQLAAFYRDIVFTARQTRWGLARLGSVR
jgi:glycosyltransferase involved in cell wall biosynthesis